MSEILQQHRHVLETSAAVVAQVADGQLAYPTPCADWTLGELLAHMIGQNYGFAAAAEAAGGAGGPGVEAFAPRPAGADVSGDYTRSVRVVLDAFATPGLIDRRIYLAEVRGGTSLPAPVAVGFHLVDYVVHGWDVARAIGVPVAFDEAALTTALRVAEAVPDEAKSTDPAAPFRPSVTTANTGTLERILATLGRSPGWAAPRTV